MSQETRQEVARAVAAAESKKAEGIVILEMERNTGAFTDYFVLCSGSNPRQIQAIADEVQKELSEAGDRPTNVEGYNQAEWVLLDYVHFVVHIFSERARKFYDLERLWKSARKLKPADLLKKSVDREPAKPAAKKAGVKKTGGKKSAKKTPPKRTGKRTTKRRTTAGPRASSKTKSSRTKPKPKSKSKPAKRKR